MSSPSKSCGLDPVPTFLVKELIDCPLPFLHTLCNKSSMTSTVPISQNKAIVFPRLKKAGLPIDDVNSYRPISNLTFL